MGVLSLCILVVPLFTPEYSYRTALMVLLFELFLVIVLAVIAWWRFERAIERLATVERETSGRKRAARQVQGGVEENQATK